MGHYQTPLIRDMTRGSGTRRLLFRSSPDHRSRHVSASTLDILDRSTNGSEMHFMCRRTLGLNAIFASHLSRSATHLRVEGCDRSHVEKCRGVSVTGVFHSRSIDGRAAIRVAKSTSLEQATYDQSRRSATGKICVLSKVAREFDARPPWDGSPDPSVARNKQLCDGR